MTHNRTLGAIGATLSLLLLCSCGSDDGSSVELSEEQVSLNRNLDRWEDAGIESYEYEYRRSCFCPPLEVVVTVQEGDVTEAFKREDGTYLSDSERKELLSINELFAVVQEAINDDVFSLEVEYDSSLGYPTRIAIDRDEQVVDEEITHYAASLR